MFFKQDCSSCRSSSSSIRNSSRRPNLVLDICLEVYVCRRRLGPHGPLLHNSRYVNNVHHPDCSCRSSSSSSSRPNPRYWVRLHLLSIMFTGCASSPTAFAFSSAGTLKNSYRPDCNSRRRSSSSSSSSSPNRGVLCTLFFLGGGGCASNPTAPACLSAGALKEDSTTRGIPRGVTRVNPVVVVVVEVLVVVNRIKNLTLFWGVRYLRPAPRAPRRAPVHQQVLKKQPD